MSFKEFLNESVYDKVLKDIKRYDADDKLAAYFSDIIKAMQHSKELKDVADLAITASKLLDKYEETGDDDDQDDYFAALEKLTDTIELQRDLSKRK
jgi:hypothetical protein